MDRDHQFGHSSRREAWRMERQAKRAAWRARRAARHASRGDWSHFGDPKFWGLDADSLRQWGFGGVQGDGGFRSGQPGEVEELKAQVAEMEKTIDGMEERIRVLERIVLDLDKDAREARLAAEIERLRDRKDGE